MYHNGDLYYVPYCHIRHHDKHYVLVVVVDLNYLKLLVIILVALLSLYHKLYFYCTFRYFLSTWTPIISLL